MNKLTGYLLTLLALAAVLSACAQAGKNQTSKAPVQPRQVWLDSLDLTQCTSEGVPAKGGQSLEGNKIKIAGRTFEHGVSVQAPSVFRLELGGRAQRFTAWVGMDDEVAGRRADYVGIRFQIFAGDGRALYDSDIIKPKEAARRVDIDLTGVDVIELLVDAPYLYLAYGDWAQACLTMTGQPPRPLELVKPAPYILTPALSPKPRINGPRIYGVRTGRPVLYQIPASGQRPMTFAVSGLPAGLSLDPATGLITGRLMEPGTHRMIVTAANSLGTAWREFTLEVGQAKVLTPPMGWNSWNCWGCGVDDAKIRAAAKAMVDSGLSQHGWSTINIDDCWQGGRDPKTGRVFSNEKFPDMKALADYVHSLGLKIGLYTDCGPKTCGGFEGSQGHEEQDIMTYAEWGFDYVKVDWCYCEGKDPKQAYALFGQAIEEAPRDIVLSICEWGAGKPWEWGAGVGGNCWRTTGDIVDTWESVHGIGFTQGPLAQYAGPGHWNDPDMMVVGQVGWGPSVRPTRLTPDEQYTHVSLWAMLAAPLLIGCDMTQLDPFTFSLLTNGEVLAVNQDALGRQARPVQEGGVQVWVKELEDGSRAVGLFNVTRVEQSIALDPKAVGVDGAAQVRDLWRQKDLGPAGGAFKATVPGHGVVLVRMTPTKK